MGGAPNALRPSQLRTKPLLGETRSSSFYNQLILNVILFIKKIEILLIIKYLQYITNRIHYSLAQL